MFVWTQHENVVQTGNLVYGRRFAAWIAMPAVTRMSYVLMLLWKCWNLRHVLMKTYPVGCRRHRWCKRISLTYIPQPLFFWTNKINYSNWMVHGCSMWCEARVPWSHAVGVARNCLWPKFRRHVGHHSFCISLAAMGPCQPLVTGKWDSRLGYR
jgi:hypothetical protein